MNNEQERLHSRAAKEVSHMRGYLPLTFRNEQHEGIVALKVLLHVYNIL